MQDWLKETMEKESPYRLLLITSDSLRWLRLLMIWLVQSLRLSLNCSPSSQQELLDSIRTKRLSYPQEIQSWILNPGK